ncbi:MAG: hypothetical protein KDI28_07235 [Pseudomonadales bacterium]|nr:hypothetical protein [Pseudomonadales bacterium]MCP5357161.1 hypothetical protein [Pseudomonadales bacterium]
MPSALIVDDMSLRARWMESLLDDMGWQHWRTTASDDALPRADITLVALVPERGNGFELATELSVKGCQRIWLMSDQPGDTDTLWARALGLEGILRIPGPVEPLRNALLTIAG